MSDGPDMHVTYEQARDQIHDTVNAIYEHNLNDPTMTQEEAIQSTAESAEKGLTYLEDLQAELEAQENAGNELQSGVENGTENAAESGVDNGAENGADDGIDDGMDGGIE